jgi:PmbA protein
MSKELLGLAERIVESGGPDEQVEAFVIHERNFQVEAYDGDVESVSSAEPRGAGVRVVQDHRAGFAYTTDLAEDGLAEVVAAARDNARHATPEEAVALADPPREPAAAVPGLVDESLSGVGPDSKVQFAVELERATRAVDRRVRAVENSVYADADSEVAIATSTGVSGAYRRTDAWCYTMAIVADGDDTQVGFDFDLARGMAALDAEELARKAVGKALRVLGAAKIGSRHVPVVLDPYTAGQLVGVLGSALTGEAVQKGRSMFAGKLGESVAAPSLTLVDDGRKEGAPGAAPWDAEGVPTRRTEVIKEGVLRSFLYDTISARREGRSSTGNAARGGFKSLPGPSPTNLAFEPTGEGRDEVLRRAGEALLVQDFHGVHSGANPVSGDFSVGVTGLLLQEGEPVQAVKEVTVAAPLHEVLGRVAAVADDRRWLPFAGSYGGATTLIEEMTVAGR